MFGEGVGEGGAALDGLADFGEDTLGIRVSCLPDEDVDALDKGNAGL